MFVTLEGPEGAGKSTVAAGLVTKLGHHGFDVVLTREPGAGPVGRQIRQILLEGSEIDQKCELFLFLADRSQHVSTIVKPALEAGQIVLCDRFADSTVVYQGYGRGLDRETLVNLNLIATAGLVPNLTLLLDIDPALGSSRLQTRDRLDNEPLEFHTKVRDGFLSEAQKDPSRWVVIDASQSPEDVLESSWLAIKQRL